MEKQIEFPKTHDLAKLVKLAESADPTIRKQIDSCAWLTPCGTEFRYPGEYPEVTCLTASKAVKEVRKVRKVILKKLKSYHR